MTLMQGFKDKNYRIIEIASKDENLKRRLYSFGITKGSIITLVHSSMHKASLVIMVGNSQIALRQCEADQILIETIA